MCRRRVPIGPTMGINNVFRKPIEAGLIPGVVALAADDRGVFYEGAFGRRTVDKPEPMTLDSIFRIASMTKAVTGTAAMQLVEEGRIGLDQPMGDVLPVIKNVKVLEGFDAGAHHGFAIREARSRYGTC
jgi:methyl acetate hydrolase